MSLDRQILFFERHFRQHPGSRFYIPLADLYRRSERIDDALELLRAQQAAGSKVIAADVIEGLCLQDAGRQQEAAAVFSRILDRDPGNMIALGFHADVAADARQWSRASGYLERILREDPENRVVQQALEEIRSMESDEAVAEAGHDPAPAPAEMSGETAEPDDAEPDDAGPVDAEAAVVEAAADPVAAAAEPAAAEPTAAEPAAAESAAAESAAAEPVADTPPESSPRRAGAGAANESDQAFATRTLADIYLAQGHTKKALAILHRIIEQDPGRADVRDEIALLEGVSAPHPTSGEKDAEKSADRAESGNRERFEAWLEREARGE